MSKKQPEVTTIIIESQQGNKEIGRQFYRYISEELKKLKGVFTNEQEKVV